MEAWKGSTVSLKPISDPTTKDLCSPNSIKDLQQSIANLYRNVRNARFVLKAKTSSVKVQTAWSENELSE